MATAKTKLNKNARAWVKALRSGKYKQTKNVLTRVDPKTGEIVGNCCLGVGCELAVAAGVPVVVKVAGQFIKYDGRDSLLPKSVQDWLGLKTNDATFSPINGSDLTMENDGCGGARKSKSFKQIARIIEQKAKELFV